MAKLPSGKEMIKVLEALGFYLDRQRGSHLVMKKDKTTIVVPVHNNDQLKIGLFKAILKDIDLSDKEFWNLK